MTDLSLSPREQDALRALAGAEPVPGRPLPERHVLELLARLVPVDRVGVALADDRGHILEEVTLPTAIAEELPELQEDGPPYLGVTHWSRNRPAAAACGTEVGAGDAIAIGFRNGSDRTAQFWLVREHGRFTQHDLALLWLTAPALQRLVRERPAPHLPACLTVQERRVLSHAATGAKNAEIAAALFVAPSTVRKHLENAYRKLGVSSRTAAVMVLRGTAYDDPDIIETSA